MHAGTRSPRRAPAVLSLAVVASNTACAASAPPPAAAVVAVPARSSTASTPSTSAPAPQPAKRVVAPEPTQSCDHGGGPAAIDAFLRATLARDLPSMLDCFSPELRDRVAADASGVVRQLASESVAPGRTLSVHTKVSFSNGVKEATTSRTVELQVGPEGARRPRTVTIRTTAQPAGWFVVDVRDGADDAEFDAIFGPVPPEEAPVTLTSRTKDELVVSLAPNTAAPPIGTQVDVLQPTRRGTGSSKHTTLVGVASGTVKKAAGSRLHVDVKTWAVRPTRGGEPLVPGAALLLQWRGAAATTL